MNREIFELQKLLDENGIPYIFNWLEEGKPSPFDDGRQLEPDDSYPLRLYVGPPLGPKGNFALTVQPEELTDNAALCLIDSTKKLELQLRMNSVTATQAFQHIKKRYIQNKNKWFAE